MCKSKKELILNEMHKTTQSASCTQLWKLNDLKLRFTVKSDSYDFQSSAIAEVWSETEKKWNRIHHIPYSLMKTVPKLSYARKTLSNSDFQQDLNALMKVAIAILQ